VHARDHRVTVSSEPVLPLRRRPQASDASGRVRRPLDEASAGQLVERRDNVAAIHHGASAERRLASTGRVLAIVLDRANAELSRA